MRRQTLAAPPDAHAAQYGESLGEVVPVTNDDCKRCDHAAQTPSQGRQIADGCGEPSDARATRRRRGAWTGRLERLCAALLTLRATGLANRSGKSPAAAVA